MNSRKPTYKELEQRIARLEKQLRNMQSGKNVAELQAGLDERTRELTHTIGTLHEEVLERTEAERSLREYSEQLRALAAKLAIAEQKERQRLAGLLHDELQQLLVAALFQVSSLNRVSKEELPPIVSEVQDLLKETIRMTRSLSSELSPALLREHGLVPALGWLVRWIQEKHGFRVELSVADEIAFETEEIRVLLYDSIRELLLNVIKHAKTDWACVTFTRTSRNTRIEVLDEGSGFDVSRISGEEFRSSDLGLGLVSIRERVALLGGSMDIESSPGKGSKVTLTVPSDKIGPGKVPVTVFTAIH